MNWTNNEDICDNVKRRMLSWHIFSDVQLSDSVCVYYCSYVLHIVMFSVTVGVAINGESVFDIK